MLMGQEVEIFRQKLQISDRISAEYCNFQTEKIMSGQHFNFALKFPQNGGLYLKFRIFNKKSSDNNKTFGQFSDSQKFTVGNCPLASPDALHCQDATDNL